MHWSGEHCHDCFIRKASNEPHPLDDDPTMRKLHSLAMEFYPRMMMPPESKSRKDIAYLPSHYKAETARGKRQVRVLGCERGTNHDAWTVSEPRPK